MHLPVPFRPLALLPAAAIALGTTASGAAACPMHGPGAAAPTTLTVQGEGSASAQPDIATVTLGVSVQAPTASQAMADNATRQQAVIDTLKAQGVQARDIQTSGLNLSPVQDYSREGKPPVITGYQAQNMVTVTVRDLSRLGGALDGLVSAGANEVNGVSFAREDQQSAEDQARTAAVASARHRAEILAQAAGLQLGGLLTLTDNGGNSGPMPMMAMARDKAAESTPIEAGELNITARVSATFALVGDEAGAGAMRGCDMHRHGHGMGGHMNMGGPGGGTGHDGWRKHGDDAAPSADPAGSQDGAAPDAARSTDKGGAGN